MDDKYHVKLFFNCFCKEFYPYLFIINKDKTLYKNN